MKEHLLQLLEKRRAVKSFDPAYKISSEDKNKILEATILTPSAFNLQHWRLVEVNDQALRQEIRGYADRQPQITSASLLYVICLKYDSWTDQPLQYWPGLSEDIQKFILGAIDKYYRGKEDVQRDECMRSCGLVAMNMMLTAQSLGIDSCPMDGFDYQKVGKAINLPDNYLVGMIVALGKKNREPHPRVGRISKEQLVIEDKF